MKCMAISLTCLMVSCSSLTLVRVEYGYGEPVYAADYLNTNGGSGQPIDLHYGSIKLGKTLWESELEEPTEAPAGVDLFIGGFTAMPIAHESTNLYGLVVTPRFRYPVKAGVDYFVAPDLGLAWGDWNEQGGEFNFLVGGQTGFLIELSAHTSISLSTGIFHISNAGVVKKNPGYNADLFMVGFEFKFGEDDED